MVGSLLSNNSLGSSQGKAMDVLYISYNVGTALTPHELHCHFASPVRSYVDSTNLFAIQKISPRNSIF